MSLASPALAGEFFTSSATWEALVTNYGSLITLNKGLTETLGHLI